MIGSLPYNYKNMMNMRQLKKNPLLIFGLVTLTAYGLLLPFTGFYWDDWPFAFIAKFLGPAEFNPAFAPYRPFLGPIFYITTSLIPPVPLYWQIFALVIRFIIGVSAWWMFQQIWPDRPRVAFIAAFLILIFPGYSQHWVAFTHINQELIPFIFYLLSFGFSFKALRTSKNMYIVIALLLQICGIFPTEYFFGIEGIRFLLLLTLFQGNLLERFIKSIKHWWPFLLIWILNAAWLVYYYKFGPYTSYEVTATQTLNVLSFIKEALDALWKAGLYIWIQILPLTLTSPTAPASLLTLGLILLSFSFFAPYLKPSEQSNEEGRNTSFAVSLILISIPAILLGRLPSLAAGLPLTLQSSYDRFMVSMMIGGTLFLLGIIELLIQNGRAKSYVFAVVISLGIGQQFFNANIFRRDWENQREIYWQMAWRIPALQPNTLLLTHQMPIDYETDISFTAPVNWMYATKSFQGQLPYLMLYTEKRLGGTTLPSFAPDMPVSFPYRTLTFNGSTSDAIVFYMPQDGCLRVFDPERGDLDVYAKLPDVLVNAIPLSDPSRIITNPAEPVTPMFFPEPEHGWCYYFAKAELAQQTDDYQTVTTLGDEARSLGFKPTDQNEWFVFIKAYALQGDYATAKKLSTAALAEDVRIRRGLCTAWKQVQDRGPAGSEKEIQQYLLTFKCNP